MHTSKFSFFLLRIAGRQHYIGFKRKIEWFDIYVPYNVNTWTHKTSRKLKWMKVQSGGKRATEQCGSLLNFTLNRQQHKTGGDPGIKEVTSRCWGWLERSFLEGKCWNKRLLCATHSEWLLFHCLGGCPAAILCGRVSVGTAVWK